MDYEIKRKEVEKHLIDADYKYFGKDTLKNAFLFQRKFKGHNFNVWEYFDVIPNLGVIYSYEVELTFNTGLNTWATAKYYSIGPDDLIASLDQYEFALFNAMISMHGDPNDYREITHDA